MKLWFCKSIIVDFIMYVQSKPFFPIFIKNKILKSFKYFKKNIIITKKNLKGTNIDIFSKVKNFYGFDQTQIQR